MPSEAGGVEKLPPMAEAEAQAAQPTKKRQWSGGIVSWVWKGIFGGMWGDDYEKRLRYLSKEEASVHARMKRRGQTTKRVVRSLVLVSVAAEVAAVAYAIMTMRSLGLRWQMRAIRLLPMIVLPGLSSIIYSTLINFTRMIDHKDQKKREKLRTERKAKIDELKERTNYYGTQKLIQLSRPFWTIQSISWRTCHLQCHCISDTQRAPWSLLATNGKLKEEFFVRSVGAAVAAAALFFHCPLPAVSFGFRFTMPDQHQKKRMPFTLVKNPCQRPHKDKSFHRFAIMDTYRELIISEAGHVHHYPSKPREIEATAKEALLKFSQQCTNVRLRSQGQRCRQSVRMLQQHSVDAQRRFR